MTATPPAPVPPTADEIAAALKNRHFTLNYQPIVDMTTRVVNGFEALMRWNHPQRGFISPGVFIPIMEESGLIVEASKWALRESCRALKRIEGRTGRNSSLYMSVNFTPRDFSGETFIFDLYNIISESDVMPNQVQLEITEDLLVNQPENALSSLTMCRKAGMKISVDDCATSKPDLDYLDKYPIDSVKIDQIHVRKILADPEIAKLVAWINKTAHAQGKTVIAEGVEKEEEAQALIATGCTQAQGYLYAKPLPEKEVTDFLLNSPLKR